MKTSLTANFSLQGKQKQNVNFFHLGYFAEQLVPFSKNTIIADALLAWYNRMKSVLSTRKLSKDGAKKHQHSPFPRCLIFCGALIKRLSLLMNLEGNLQHLNVHLIASVLEASLSKS